MMFRRNVLIFHGGALGDFVLSWPLALALGRLFPQNRIIYITQSQKGALAERVLKVDWVDVEGGWHHLFGDPAGLPAAAVKLLGNAHSVYSFVSTPADSWTRHVRRLTGLDEVVSLQTTPPGDYAGHATQYLVEQLQCRPVVQSAVRQLLRSIGEQGIRAFAPAEGGVLIHPGSGSPQKCWPMDRFIQLVGRLRDAGRTVRIVLGDVEAERWDARQIEQLSAAAEVLRPVNHVELAGHLAGASLVVANDSGPGHLAAVLGVPTVSLFGPTDPKVWRPVGPCVEVLHARPLEALTVGDVCNAARRMLGKGRVLPVPAIDEGE